MIRIDVIGIPASQGSKTRMPNGAMVDGTSATGRAKLVEWRRAVADAGRAWLVDNPQGPLSGPVQLDVTFRFPATKSDPHRHHHATMPDASKVLRATEDALVSAGLIVDDRLICDLSVTKLWCDVNETPGAQITLRDLTDNEAAHRAARKAAARDRKAVA